MSGGTRAQRTAPERPATAGSSGSSASVLLLRALVLGATRLGLTIEQLSQATRVQAAMFSDAALADPDGRVPAALLLELWEYLPRHCADEASVFGSQNSCRLRPSASRPG